MILISILHENESKFSVSLDAWTSSNGYAFLAIVLHCVGNDGRLRLSSICSQSARSLTLILEECLIDFIELHGAHTGENMADAIWQSLKSYGLIGKVCMLSLNFSEAGWLICTFRLSPL